MKAMRLKQLLGLLLLVGTLTFFVYYFVSHPEVGKRLGDTPPTVIATILLLYVLNILTVALITIATLRMCKIKLPGVESVRITAYTLLVNFFGPLQSGPAFRAVYLKKKHGVSLKKYAGATLIYYLVFGILGCLSLASYWLDWRLALFIALGMVGVYLVLKSRYFKSKLINIDMRGWYLLALATLLQFVVMTLIYYVELRSTVPGTSLHQAIIYSGAANLALFVSLTPGAIGIRESFLAFTQNLHGINNTAIITANILDRALFIVLLALLAVGIFVTHTKEALTSDSPDKKTQT